MILNNIAHLIEEGKTAKKRGFRFKEVTDPKTGKSHLFQVVRGAGEGLSIIKTTNTINNRYIRTNKDGTPITTSRNTVNGKVEFPTIQIPDQRGRAHPAAFYHEVGHQLRNKIYPKASDDPDPDEDNGPFTKRYRQRKINDEKTAWQGAKDISPEHYNLAKQDGTLERAFGSYVKVNRSLADQERISKKQSELRRLNDIDGLNKLKLEVKRKREEKLMPSSLMHEKNLSPEQHEEYKRRGWLI